jgi:hypothetical protein
MAHGGVQEARGGLHAFCAFALTKPGAARCPMGLGGLPSGFGEASGPWRQGAQEGRPRTANKSAVSRAHAARGSSGKFAGGEARVGKMLQVARFDARRPSDEGGRTTRRGWAACARALSDSLEGVTFPSGWRGWREAAPETDGRAGARVRPIPLSRHLTPPAPRETP